MATATVVVAGNTNGKIYKRKPAAAVVAMLEALTAALRGCHKPTGNGMANTLAKYRVGYVVSVTADGRKSLNNGDELAELLEGLDHMQVARVAELALDLEIGFLATKYAKLNNGQIRMNSGNRIRAALKSGKIYIDAVHAAKAALV